MPNGIQPQGDDQKWKREIEKSLQAILKRLAILETRVGGGK